MLFYTNKNLVEMIPIRDKTWEECGIDMNTVKVFITEDGTNAFFEVIDLEKFNDVKLADAINITEDEMKKKIEKIKIEQDKEMQEYYKTTDSYKIDMLKKENEELKTMIEITQSAINEILFK